MTTEHKESECKGPAIGYDFVSYGLRVFFRRRNSLSCNPGDLRGGTHITEVINSYSQVVGLVICTCSKAGKLCTPPDLPSKRS